MALQCISISVYEPTWKQMLLGREVCARRVLHKIWPEKLEFLSLLSYKTPINLKQGDHLLKLFLFPKNKTSGLYYSSVAYHCWNVYQICCVRVCVCVGKPVLFLWRDDPIHSFNKFTWVTLIYCGNMRAIVAAHLLQDVDDSSYNNTCKREGGKNYVTLITWKKF